ncbi:hypothetical protein [Micromonospora sp. MH33]|uniref:hypothetical protein n=1 Tax=Micromonospora sp. MH33 TaxID=1945509 RepID=UPI001AEF986C|nr:hypothetical protein [Micromonospora sp. MH33]
MRAAVERDVRAHVDRSLDAILGATPLPAAPLTVPPAVPSAAVVRPDAAQVNAVADVVRQVVTDLPARVTAAAIPDITAPHTTPSPADTPAHRRTDAPPVPVTPEQHTAAATRQAETQFTALARKYGVDPASHDTLAGSFQQDWVNGYHQVLAQATGNATPATPSVPGTSEVPATPNAPGTPGTPDAAGARTTVPGGAAPRTDGTPNHDHTSDRTSVSDLSASGDDIFSRDSRPDDTFTVSDLSSLDEPISRDPAKPDSGDRDPFSDASSSADSVGGDPAGRGEPASTAPEPAVAATGPAVAAAESARRVADWIDQTPVGPDNSRDPWWWCVQATLDAYTTAYGRPGNRTVSDDRILGPDGRPAPTTSWPQLLDILDATPERVAHPDGVTPEDVLAALRAAPGSMVVVKVAPPNEPQHVFALHSQPQPPGLPTIKVRDGLVPGAEDRPEPPDPTTDPWLRHLFASSTRLAAFDSTGRPTTITNLLPQRTTAHPQPTTTTSIDPNAILLASTTPPRGPSQAMQADTTSPEPSGSPWQPSLPEETGDAAGTGPAFVDPEFQDLNALNLNTPTLSPWQPSDQPARLPESGSGSSDPVSDSLPGRPAAMEWHPPADAGSDAGGQLSDGDGYAVPPGFPGYESGVSEAPLNPGGGEPPTGAGRVVVMEVDAEPRTPVPPPATTAPAPPEIVYSPAWDDFFRQVLVSAGGQVAETLGLPTVEIDDVRHYLAIELDRIVQRTDIRQRLKLSNPSLEVLRQALDSRQRSVPGLTQILPHLVSEAFGINIAVSGSETVRHDQGAGTGQGLLRRSAGRGPAAAHGGPDSGEFGSESMVQETGDRAGLPADVADGWTAGNPPQLTGGYTKKVQVNRQGQLTITVGGKKSGIGAAAADREATVWFGRTDGSPAGEPAAWIKVGSLEGREGGPFWRWLDPAPTQKDLDRLKTYKSKTERAGEWTAGDPPQLTGGYTKKVPLDRLGRLAFTVGGKTPAVGVVAADREATVWFGHRRTDGSPAGEPAAWIKVGSLEGREGGPFWRWLDPAPTQKDLDRLRNYEPRTVHAGEWTARKPPQLTDGYTKEVQVNQQGQLTITVDGKKPGVGAAAADREATVWFGRTDGSPAGEPAAWIEVGSLEGREGGPFWRWLDPAPTEDDLNRLKTYEPRTAHAGEWTAGSPPQLTGGYTKKVPIDRYGRLTITVDGKTPRVGVVAAGREATVWFGRTDGSPEGEPAALIKVESLNDRDGGPFWRWLDPAPTEDDLNRLKTYKSTTEHAGGWTAGSPPQLTGGYTKMVPIDRYGRLTITVDGKTPRVGVVAAGREATVWFGRTDGSPEGEPAALIKVESLNDRDGGPFWRWLDPAPTEDDLNRLKTYKSTTERAGGWTAGSPPELTGEYTKRVQVNQQGQLTTMVDGKKVGVGVIAAGREATVRFGYRTDRRPEGEPAAWIKVESLNDRGGGPFWRWLDPAPTEEYVARLRSYESTTVRAGGRTVGDPPLLTGGSSGNAAAVAPASIGSVGMAFQAAQDTVDFPGSNTDGPIPSVDGSWARPVVGIPVQGQLRPGVASAQVDRGQPAVRTPTAAPAPQPQPQPQPQPLERWPQAAGQAGATQRSADAFWDVVVDRSSLVSLQRPAVASVAGPDPMLPVPADGYCMLYAFIATDPIGVRDVLHPRLPVDLARFLSDPGRVRTSVVGLVGSEVSGESALARVSALLQAHVRGYLDSNAGRLPADVTRQRTNFREQRVRQVAALSHQQVLNWLRYLDSSYVTEAGMLPTVVIEHRYHAVRATAMLSGGPLDLGEPTDAPQRQLDFLTQHNQGFPVEDLAPGAARDFLVGVLSESDRQLEPDELAVVRAAVDNWKQQWSAPAGEFLGPLLAHATGRRVTIWRESGWGAQPMISAEYGPAAGRPADLYHVAADPNNPTILNHYNAAAVNNDQQGAGASPATSAPVDTQPRQVQVGQGPPAARTSSPPRLTATIRSRPDPDQPNPEPRTTPLQRRHLGQGRTEIIWATPEEVSAEQELVLMREITDSVQPDPAMDDAFPWRDADDPRGRVYAPFADDDGQVHPVVRANADRITASMTSGRRLLKDIASNPDDPRLPSIPDEEMERLWPLLEQMVAAEIRRLVLGESLENRRVKVLRMTANLLEPHERGPDSLEGKLGLALDDALLQQFLMELLGPYLGAVLENKQREAAWKQIYRLYPSYSMSLETYRTSNERPGRRSRGRRLVAPRRGKRSITMSAEGFANSIAFANTALKPGTREPDIYRTNSVYLQFTVRIPDNDNRIRRQEIMMLFGMNNLFDLSINPHRIVIADYGPDYYDGEENFPPIKQEPDTTPPPT